MKTQGTHDQAEETVENFSSPLHPIKCFQFTFPKPLRLLFFAAAASVHHVPCINAAAAALCGLLCCGLVNPGGAVVRSEVVQLHRRNHLHTRLHHGAEAHVTIVFGG